MMIVKNKEKTFLFCTLFLITLLLTGTDVFAESREQERKWSFIFHNCAVSEALNQIANVTKREICLKGKTNKKVDRSYDNQGVEEIIRDILRKEDYILFMFSMDNEIGSVKIWLLNSGEKAGSHAYILPFKNNKESLGDNMQNESAAAFRKSDFDKNKRTETFFHSKVALAPPVPKKRLGLEPPPTPPGLPMQSR